jgi:mannose-6-phosphate isomerase-like protein (cupin superfamily)
MQHNADKIVVGTGVSPGIGAGVVEECPKRSYAVVAHTRTDDSVKRSAHMAVKTGRISVRRLVTGHDSSGKSVFASDEMVEPDSPIMMPSGTFYQLWGGDETPHFPNDGSMPDWHTYFPPVGGFRFGLVTISPETIAGELQFLNDEEAVADIEVKLPGFLRYMDPSDPGMHASDTIDFGVVLEGSIVLELDDGAKVTLNPGDTVVQNGTRHRWKNPGSTPARMVFFLCGARHDAVPPA